MTTSNRTPVPHTSLSGVGPSGYNAQSLPLTTLRQAIYSGNAAAINGETVLIGAPGVDDAGPEAGAAYVFIQSDTEWIQQAKLIGNDTSMFDHFGTAVALHENTAVIGAHGKDESSVDAGAAYIFVRNGGSWTQQAKLTHQNAVPGDQFGRAVAIYSDSALIGAHRSDATGPDSGAAYIFTRNGDTWSQDFQLIPNDSGLGDEFGLCCGSN